MRIADARRDLKALHEELADERRAVRADVDPDYPADDVEQREEAKELEAQMRGVRMAAERIGVVTCGWSERY